MKFLDNWAFLTKLRVGGDIWSLSGTVYNHERFRDGTEVSVSSIISFNEQEMTIKTKSGSEYKLGTCVGNLEKQIEFIKKEVIENEGRQSES